MMKWGVRIVVVGALLAGTAWLYRDELILQFVDVVADCRFRVGPHREVTWDTGPDPAGRAPGDRPPNVVLILADDLGWNDLTFRGGGVAEGTVPTPRIDSIAREGVSFTNGYAANGTCAPSRAALMSGRYGTRFGFEFTPTPPMMVPIMMRIGSRMPGRLRRGISYVGERETIPYGEMGMPSSEITLAELLGQADYHTVHIGKWHLGR